jgi:hypothetical protein
MRIKVYLDKASRIRDGRLHQNVTPGEEYFVLGIDRDDFRVINDSGDPILYPKELFEVLDAAIPAGWRLSEDEEDRGYYYLDPIRTSEPGFWEDFHCSDRGMAARERSHFIVREVLEAAMATVSEEERRLIRRDLERLRKLRLQ